MSDPLIEVENLSYAYPDGAEALRGVSFRMQQGETIALLGPNGSGKTTFALHLNGILQGQGRVRIAGLLLTAATLPQIRQKIGFVFQDADEQLFLSSVWEDVLFGPRNLGLAEPEAQARAEGALRQVGMHHARDRAPYHLSAGEKRRVALAGVLAMDPEVLVLDEPTTFLDPPGWNELVHLLRAAPQAKLIITHDVSFATALAARAVFFEQGAIVADGPINAVIRKFDWLPRAQEWNDTPASQRD